MARISNIGSSSSGSGSGISQADADARYLDEANNLSDLDSVATARTNLGVAIGVDVQAYSANLAEYAAVNPTAAGLALLDDADTAAQLITLGFTSTITELNYTDGVTSAIQTQLDGKQPLDTDLTTLAGLTATTNNFIISVGSAWASRTPTQALATLGLDADLTTFSVPASTTISAFGATLVDDADTGTARTTLGLVAGGAGDIWVEKAGDTMTGNLVIGDDHFLNVDGSAVFNETGASVDIRMEGDTNANLFFLDGSADKIGFGTSTPAERLNVIGNFQVDDATTSTKGYRFRTSGFSLDLDAAAANLLLSTYTGAGFTGTQRQYIEFGAEFEFEKHYKKTIWDSSGDMFVIDKDAADGFVWNETGADKNARFEGDTDASLLFVDAGVDRVGIGTNAPAEKLHIVNTDYTTMRFDAASDSGYFYADGVFHFIVLGSRTDTDVLFQRNATERMTFAATENIMNDAGNDVDFRVESDTLTGALFVDASNDALHCMNHTTGKLSFFGATAVTRVAAYTPTNVTTDRAYDANSTSIDEIADVLGTLIADLKSYGLLQS